MEDSKVVLNDGSLQPIPEDVESESDKNGIRAGTLLHTRASGNRTRDKSIYNMKRILSLSVLVGLIALGIYYPIVWWINGIAIVVIIALIYFALSSYDKGHEVFMKKYVLIVLSLIVSITLSGCYYKICGHHSLSHWVPAPDSIINMELHKYYNQTGVIAKDTLNKEEIQR